LGLPFAIIPLAAWAAYAFWPGTPVQEVHHHSSLEGLVYAEIITISEERVQVRLTNDSQYMLMFHGGRPFALEQHVLFRWREAPLRMGIGFNDSLGGIPAHSSSYFYVYLETTYRRNLSIQRSYRLRLEVLFADASPLPTFPMYNAIYDQQRELTYTKSPFLKDKRGGDFA